MKKRCAAPFDVVILFRGVYTLLDLLILILTMSFSFSLHYVDLSVPWYCLEYTLFVMCITSHTTAWHFVKICCLFADCNWNNNSVYLVNTNWTYLFIKHHSVSDIKMILMSICTHSNCTLNRNHKGIYLNIIAYTIYCCFHFHLQITRLLVMVFLFSFFLRFKDTIRLT